MPDAGAVLGLLLRFKEKVLTSQEMPAAQGMVCVNPIEK